MLSRGTSERVAVALRDDPVTTFSVRFGMHSNAAYPLRLAQAEEVHGHLLCAASNAGRGLALLADAAVLVLQVAPEAIRWLYTGEAGHFYRVHPRGGGVPGAVALTPVMGGSAELRAWAPDLAPWLARDVAGRRVDHAQFVGAAAIPSAPLIRQAAGPH